MDGEQLIKTIDESYYRDEVDFNLDHLTEQLPEHLTSDYLSEYKSKLERLLSLVTRKISELVLSHQPAYVSELERIADLQKSITESIHVCSKGRRCLRFIKDGTAKHGSTIVENLQKRESLSKLLKSLIPLNELKSFVIEIRSLIDNQEFPRALQMCEDGRALLASFHRYKCVPSSDDLKSCINNRALNFFNRYHSSSVEELKMFLENETWEMLPVNNDFKLAQLKEFSFLRQAAKDTSEDMFDSEVPQEGSSYFDQPDALPLDRISLSSDSDLESELAKDFVDEEGNHSSPATQLPSASPPSSHLRLTKHSGPVLTNSSLSVLRLAGKYVQMMQFLSPISFEILMKIYRLLDQYTSFVYKKFSPDNDKNLNAVIKSLRESLIGNNQTNIEDATSSLLNNDNIGPTSQSTETTSTSNSINQADDQNKEQSVPISSQKAVAIESLIFLVNQLWNLQEYLESLITADQRAQLREQFSQNNSTIPNFLKARADLGPNKTTFHEGRHN